MSESPQSDWCRPFNTPFESGLRSVALLVEAYPAVMDLNRLQAFDYLAVHSGDIDGGPASLHPPTPHRSGELLVRRRLVEDGLSLMWQHGLLDKGIASNGFVYSASDLAAAFLDRLSAPYTMELREVAKWLVATFAAQTDLELNNFIVENLDRWGSEFESESLVRPFPI